MWAARATWVAIGIVAPWADLADGRSAAVSAVLLAWGWAAWLSVMVSLCVPAALSLTAVRIVVPALAAAGFVAADPAWAGLGVFAVVVLLSAHIADILVQGSAYGAETRFALRTPVPYLAPAVVVWSALAASSVGGSLLVAAGNLPVGIPVVVIGIILAWRVPVRLHRLSRRWLVVVPAGLVVHDHLVLGETMMVRRGNLGPVTLLAGAGEEADLTGAVPGRRVRIVMAQPEKIILAPITMRTLGTTEALHVVSFAVAPLRAAAAVAAVEAALSPGQ
jgi:hypothetical protein